MSCLTFVVISWLPHAAAQVGLYERRHGMDGKHIILNSRGGASHEHRGDTDAEKGDTDEEPSEFIQIVNGSTPTGWVHLGTPPKEMRAIFDTGSDKFVAKTWETLEAEMASFDPSSVGMVRPTMFVYDDSTSQTYAHKMVWKNDTREWIPEREMISYGSGEAETLDGFDTLHVGGQAIQNMTLSEITADSLQLLHTAAGISAVMGLQHMKNKSLGQSVFSIARNRSMFSSFGYCVDPRGRQASKATDDELAGDNGTFIWADKSTEGTKLDVVGDMHWAVKLGSMRVIGGKPVNVTDNAENNTDADAVRQKFKDVEFTRGEPRLRQTEPHNTRGTFGRGDATPVHEELQDDEEVVTEAEAACTNNSCCGILDSGSNIIAGPTHLMKAIADQLNVDPFCKNYEKLPEIELVFGGMTVNISKEGYVMKVPVPEWAGNGDDAGNTQTLGADKSAENEDDQPDAAMPMKRWSLNQVTSKLASKRNWKAVFEQFHKERGINFLPVLRDFLETDNHTDGDAPSLMCMPALVPLDMHTKFGPLLIVGTPLLATHYARWSFPKNATNPTIHLKKLEECARCKQVHEPQLLQAGTARSFIRSESQGTPSSTQPVERSSGPFIRHLDDIRFPHWARHITDI